MSSVKMRLENKCFEASINGGEFQPLYICSLHKVGSYVPLMEKWEDAVKKGELNDWLALPSIDEKDPTLPENLKIDIVSRPDGDSQATCNGYQLYCYQGKGDGVSPGFWELAALARMEESPISEKKVKGGGIIEPNNARGP